MAGRPPLRYTQEDLQAAQASKTPETLQASTGILGKLKERGAVGQKGREWQHYKIPEVGELVDSASKTATRTRLQIGVIDFFGRAISMWKEDGEFNDEVEKYGVTKEYASTIQGAWESIRDSSGTKRKLIGQISKCWQIDGRSVVVVWPVNDLGDPFYEVITEKQDGSMPSEQDIVLTDPNAKPASYVYKAFASHNVRTRKDPVTGEEHVSVRMAPYPGFVRIPQATAYLFMAEDVDEPNKGIGWVAKSDMICRIINVARQVEYAVSGSQIVAPPTLVPSQASRQNPMQGPTGPGGVSGQNISLDQLEAVIGEAVQAAMSDVQAGEQVISRLIGMDSRYIKDVRVLAELRREIDPQLGALIERQRRYLAEVAPVPPEAMAGYGATNRWNGKEVIEDGYRRWTLPLAQDIGDMMLASILRPQLRHENTVPTEVIARLTCWVDGRDAVPAVEAWRVAVSALQLGAVGFKGFRQMMQIPGLAAADGPEDTYIGAVKPLAQQVGIDPNEGRKASRAVDDNAKIFDSALFFGLHRANSQLKTLAQKLPKEDRLRASVGVLSPIGLHEAIGPEAVGNILNLSDRGQSRPERYGQAVDYLVKEFSDRGYSEDQIATLCDYALDGFDAALFGDSDGVDRARYAISSLMEDDDG